MLRSFSLGSDIMMLAGGDFINYILPNIKNNISNSSETIDHIYRLIYKLSEEHLLNESEYLYILDHISVHETKYLFHKAFQAKLPFYQNRVFLRGLIEISNHCVKGCRYCGINRNNKKLERYRLTGEEILACCDKGYDLGYRTFVLQGGEDPYFTDNIMVNVITKIKQKYPESRITLSLGERSFDSYKKLYEAGANRYLVRHESASRRLYEHLHPKDSNFDNRLQSLWNLKEIGYQTGTGFMVGSPSQTNGDLVKDLLFLKELNPHMVGVGPYLCHEKTEFKGSDSGSLLETLIMIALTRLIVPMAMLPATTALGTLDILGRENALNVGANVMMPNISPQERQELYEIYQNKRLVKDTNEHNRDDTERRVKRFNHVVDFSVGDVHSWKG